MKKSKAEQIVYGFHAVREALSLWAPTQEDELYLARRDEGRLKGLLQKFKKHKGTIKHMSYAQLTDLCQSENHQGIVLVRKSPLEVPKLTKQSLFEERNSLIYVGLERVQDPRNLGAALRSSLALGVAGIILTIHGTAPYSASVLKSSATAMLKLPVLRISSMASFLQELKDKNPSFYIIGADLEGVPLRKDLVEEWQSQSRPLLLVFGCEEGMADLTKKRCDILVKIPLNEKVESYNLSVACALLLYEIQRNKLLIL
ncbi:MAG: RNA methyltransferase [Leptospiraceae bacterium]|nr:RNA methyltransferase [Leptospiraceae bacterium]MDW8306280.1 RNA methyltransferase [Leptospiraceae bacterium]